MENWPPPQPHRRRLWAGNTPAEPPPPPPPPPPPRGGSNFPLIAIGLGLVALGAVIAAIASSGGDDHKSRPSVASNSSVLTNTVETPPPTAPVPTTTTPTTTVPTPPLHPRHIVHKSVVGTSIPQRDDGVLFRVDSIRQVRSIPHERYRDPIEAAQGKHLIRADITWVNKTTAPLDVFCGGYAARLVDSRGHRVAPLDNYIDIKGNDDVCGTKVQPNATSHAILGFSLPRSRGVRGIFVFNAKAADFDGADSKIFFATR